MKILRRANEKFDQIVEDCAPRPQQLVQVTVTVAVDPVWHGHDLAAYEAEETIRRAINSARGLQVTEVAA